MRRVGLFAAFLLLLGLTTATAASFSVQAEDITSFSTPVSISVPATVLPDTLYIRGDADLPPGQIDLAPPPKNDSVTSALIKLETGSTSLQAQSDPDKYFTWQTPSAPTGGYVFQGTVTLYIEQNNGPSNNMTAGLFDCAGAEPDPSSNPATCTGLREAVGEPGAINGNGYEERVVKFGTFPQTTIAQGRQLRLKIVNSSPSSTADWSLQWGYLPARKSRLEITP